MKKAYKYVLMFLVLVFFSSMCLVACKDKSKSETFMINGLNNYDEVMALDMINFDGSANVNKDAKYITEGNGSFEININKKKGIPTFRLKTVNAVSNKKDISDIYKYTLDIYNASNQEILLYFRVATSSNYCVDTSVTLVQGLNNLSFDVNRIVTSFIGDNSSFYEFSLGGIADGVLENKICLYMDNFVAHITSEKVSDEVRKPIKDVIDQISSLSLSNAEKVFEAEKNYNNLSKDEKLGVYNYSSLTDMIRDIYAKQILEARKNDKSTLFFFDEDYGKGHITATLGGIANCNISSDKAFEGEKKSLKVEYGNFGEVWTTIKYDLGTYQTKDYQFIEFSVYNDSTQEKALLINWLGVVNTEMVKLEANAWTKITMPAKNFFAMPANEIDIAGFKTSFEKGDGAHPMGNLYFSRFNGIAFNIDETAQTVIDLIDNLPLNPTESDIGKIEIAKQEFDKLSFVRRDMVIAKNYDVLKNAMNKVYSPKVREIQKQNPDTFLAFDSICGLSQITLENGVYASYSTGKKLNGERGSTLIDFSDNASVWRSINYNGMNFVSSAYDYIHMNIYNHSNVMGGIFINWMGNNIGTSSKPNHQPYALAPNSWTEIIFPASYLEMNGKIEFNLCGYNASSMDVLKPEGEWYFSRLKGIRITEKAKNVINLINNLPSEITNENKNLVNEAETAYNNLNDTEKLIVNNKNYNTLYKTIVEVKKLNNPNTVAFFDEEFGLTQIRESAEFDNEKKGIKFSGTAENTLVDGVETHKPDWKSFHLDTPSIKKLSDYDELRFMIFYEERQDKIIGNNAKFLIFWADDGFTLSPNVWNEVVIKKSDNYRNFPSGTYPKYHINDMSELEFNYNISGNIYISKIEVKNYNIDETTDNVIKKINLLPTNITLANKDYVVNLKSEYEALSASQKDNIYKFDVEKIYSAYNKIMELMYYTNANQDNKIIYFDEEFGCYQFKTESKFTYSNEKKLENCAGAFYFEGNATVDTANWQSLYLKNPSITNITSYDAMILDVYYEETTTLEGSALLNFQWCGDFVLKPNSWNTIIVIKEGRYKNFSETLAKDIANLEINFNISGKLYFGDMKVYSYSNAINSVINGIINMPEITIDSKAHLQDLRLNFDALVNVDLKIASVLGLEKDLILAEEKLHNLVIENEEKFQSKKLSNYSSDTMFTGNTNVSVSVVTDKVYAKESNALKFDIPGEGYKDFTHKFTKKSLDDFKRIYFYVYNDSAITKHIRFNWQENGTFNLSPNAWTKISISPNLFIFGETNVTLELEQHNDLKPFYFSNIYGVYKDNIFSIIEARKTSPETVLFFDKDFGIDHITSYNSSASKNIESVKYNTTIKYGNELGSLEVMLKKSASSEEAKNAYLNFNDFGFDASKYSKIIVRFKIGESVSTAKQIGIFNLSLNWEEGKYNDKLTPDENGWYTQTFSASLLKDNQNFTFANILSSTWSGIDYETPIYFASVKGTLL